MKRSLLVVLAGLLWGSLCFGQAKVPANLVEVDYSRMTNLAWSGSLYSNSAPTSRVFHTVQHALDWLDDNWPVVPTNESGDIVYYASNTTVSTSGWQIVTPASLTVQASLDDIDDRLTAWRIPLFYDGQVTQALFEASYLTNMARYGNQLYPTSSVYAAFDWLDTYAVVTQWNGAQKSGGRVTIDAGANINYMSSLTNLSVNTKPGGTNTTTSLNLTANTMTVVTNYGFGLTNNAFAAGVSNDLGRGLAHIKTAGWYLFDGYVRGVLEGLDANYARLTILPYTNITSYLAGSGAIGGGAELDRVDIQETDTNGEPFTLRGSWVYYMPAGAVVGLGVTPRYADSYSNRIFTAALTAVLLTTIP